MAEFGAWESTYSDHISKMYEIFKNVTGISSVSINTFSQLLYHTSSQHISPLFDQEDSVDYVDYTIKRDTADNNKCREDIDRL